MRQSRNIVEDNLLNIDACEQKYICSESLINKCIKSLKKESAAGIDGLTAEHILFAKDSNLSAHLCYLFSICFQHGVVPEDFRSGIMVPILKKPTLDPSIPKNYRPIIISMVFSKLVEKYILHETNETELMNHNLVLYMVEEQTWQSPWHMMWQPTVTVVDPLSSCVGWMPKEPLTVFHILFSSKKPWGPCLTVQLETPLHTCVWYTQLKVYVRWNGLGGPINISKGTRQGGLTSTHLFNCFYKDLIKEILCTDGGITIDGHRFSVYCYADDLLLASTSVTGLQSLIDSANSYMIEHGLSFNSAKTA